MAKKRGQPEKPDGERRKGLIQLRVRADEKEAIEDASELAGLSLSAWIRERLRGAARSELEGASQSVAFVTTAKRGR